MFLGYNKAKSLSSCILVNVSSDWSNFKWHRGCWNAVNSEFKSGSWTQHGRKTAGGVRRSKVYCTVGHFHELNVETSGCTNNAHYWIDQPVHSTCFALPVFFSPYVSLSERFAAAPQWKQLRDKENKVMYMKKSGLFSAFLSVKCPVSGLLWVQEVYNQD